MASSFEKSVKGGTKIKLAAPKSKYVEHILVATHAGEAGVGEIFRALTNRLRDSTWTIVFKSLIIVHLMIREGEPDVTLKYLSQSPQRKLAINHFTEVQTQGHNIRTYSEYLLRRAIEYGNTKVDYVRNGEARFKRLTVEKGLLRETESVQSQIKYLLRCQPFADEPENEISLTAFRLLTMDLLVLFHVMNEGTINVLEHYFELSKPDATRALEIYRTFVKQTELVVNYLGVARVHEHSTRLEIPKIKHAPTSLAASLEEYLNDKDFEINRRQYLAEKEAKKAGGKATNGASKPAESKVTSKPTTTTSQPAAAPTRPLNNAPLIDLFESIQDNQQTLGQPPPQMQQYPQPTGFQPSGYPISQQNTTMGIPPAQQQSPQQAFNPVVAQNTNPFAQMQQQQQPQMPQVIPQQQPQIQTQFTGAGFGGYTPQPQPFSPQSPQNGAPAFSSPPTLNLPSNNPQPSFNTLPAISELSAQHTTSTNPFRQSMMPQPTGMGGMAEPKLLGNPTGATSLSRSPTNPFAKGGGFQSVSPQQTGLPNPTLSGPSPFAVPSINTPQASSPFAPQIQAPQQSSSPFAPQPQTQQALQPTPTGTNPFARNTSPQNATSPPPASQGGGLTVHATGSTNPFRQSAFVNQATGQGWQAGTQQGTLGGISVQQVDTVGVFPRPGQQQQQGAGMGQQGWS